VIDTGIGMRAEDLRDIFQAFHQAGKTEPGVQEPALA
jgi:signal transduction histidine kinase